MPYNVLVTGGTGQIGAYVCSELLTQGNNNSVIIYDLRPNQENLSMIASRGGGGEERKARRPEIVTGDVQNLEELLKVIKSKNITHIIHLAALLVLDSKKDPTSALKVNCVGTNNIFEAARLQGLRRVVFTSSVVVYGKTKYFSSKIVSEDDFPRCPADPYSITKFANELMSEYYRQNYGLDLLCLRLSGAWGPGRYTGYTGQFNDFIRQVALGKPADLPANFAYRDAKLRWLYVKEMGRCIAHAVLAEQTKKRGLYNVGTRAPYKALDVIKAIKECVPSARINYEETDAPTEISSDIAGPSGLDVDCSKLYDELGFVEEMDLEGAVRDMVAFEKSRALA